MKKPGGDAVAIPGDRLGELKEIVPGDGTYVLGDAVYSSIVGFKRTGDEREGRVRIDIIRARERKATVLPGVGDVVTARVTKVNARSAQLEILFTEGKMLRDTFPGIIRTKDVRAFDIDAVQIYQSYRPGDIVRAEVQSLGDSKSYYLSTAKNNLGVIKADSAAGHAMIPLSWKEMQCPVTRRKEPRKVAKTKISAEGSQERGGEASSTK
eukprot:CAMPEP_0185255460 /NCGR_PEP_ID=MMETSP1359-20130426/4497_1 /TAXON_ID=552665 /ORGANISM="Bigelowiella longifila, Strain CCMP242" /LENGTH=209 /DNA_ID=CAMNT_0027839371 /DNA_START=16 /DNA_END=645 /DNA_ORIENTATION=+